MIPSGLSIAKMPYANVATTIRGEEPANTPDDIFGTGYTVSLSNALLLKDPSLPRLLELRAAAVTQANANVIRDGFKTYMETEVTHTEL